MGGIGESPREKLRRLWESPWLALASAVLFGLAWLAVDSALGSDNSLTIKLLSAALSALVGAVVTGLLQLYLRISSLHERFNTLDEAVDKFHSLRESLYPSLYVSNGMKSFHEKLIAWQAELDTTNGSASATLVERAAWKLLADAYFKGEHKKVESKTFRTTSDQFTKLVDEVSQTLENNLSGGRESVLRTHVTGMLPEEFYNGPQIEFSRETSLPLFFCHKWEGYGTLYDSESYGGDSSSRVRRYILVRDDHFQRNELSALSTESALGEQSRLLVHGNERKISDDAENESEAVLHRLFRKAQDASEASSPESSGSPADRDSPNGTNSGRSGQSQLSRARLLHRINRIHGIEGFHYWPIEPKREVASVNGTDSLLTAFVDQYHKGNNDEAFYCVLDNNAWAYCENNPELRACFQPGWVPEIALFGVVSQGSQRSVRWQLGIQGLWRPFTRDIELRFLTRAEACALAERLDLLYLNKTSSKGKLSSLSNPSPSPR